MLHFRSYALASFLIARGNTVDSAKVDPAGVPYFLFADTPQARADEIEYRRVVKYLDGLAKVACLEPSLPRPGAAC
jgi:hypothetical protein